MTTLTELRAKFRTLWPHLDERMRRLMAASEAKALGYGGVSLISRASGLSRKAIRKGIQEIEAGVATLSGLVDSIGAKTDAQNTTRKNEDVLRTVNDIQIDTEGITSNQIVTQARRKLLGCYEYTVYDYVELEAHGNTLVILGEVTQPYKKVAIAGKSLNDRHFELAKRPRRHAIRCVETTDAQLFVKLDVQLRVSAVVSRHHLLPGYSFWQLFRHERQILGRSPRCSCSDKV